MPKKKQWVRQWDVPSSSGDGTWKVSLKEDGTYACSCPAWKFAKAPKPDCRHIEMVRDNPECVATSPKRRVLAMVDQVTPRGTDELLTPLIPIGDLHFSLTVACDLARLGASSEDVAEYLNKNSLRVAKEYIAQHGRKIYGPRNESRGGHDGFRIVWDAPGGVKPESEKGGS